MYPARPTGSSGGDAAEEARAQSRRPGHSSTVGVARVVAAPAKASLGIRRRHLRRTWRILRRRVLAGNTGGSDGGSAVLATSAAWRSRWRGSSCHHRARRLGSQGLKRQPVSDWWSRHARQLWRRRTQMKNSAMLEMSDLGDLERLLRARLDAIGPRAPSRPTPRAQAPRPRASSQNR